MRLCVIFGWICFVEQSLLALVATPSQTRCVQFIFELFEFGTTRLFQSPIVWVPPCGKDCIIMHEFIVCRLGYLRGSYTTGAARFTQVYHCVLLSFFPCIITGFAWALCFWSGSHPVHLAYVGCVLCQSVYVYSCIYLTLMG